ncbi:hypothetical protein, partial [Escherichia coli]|uniref:hypothetical protein n=1 Tax=Escherichia coli TaxID=562 RepID=UPI00200E58FA
GAEQSVEMAGGRIAIVESDEERARRRIDHGKGKARFRDLDVAGRAAMGVPRRIRVVMLRSATVRRVCDLRRRCASSSACAAA